VRAGLARGEVGELVHVRRPDEVRARVEQPLGDGRVVLGLEGERVRAAGHRDARDGDVVLDRDFGPRERARLGAGQLAPIQEGVVLVVVFPDVRRGIGPGRRRLEVTDQGGGRLRFGRVALSFGLGECESVGRRRRLDRLGNGIFYHGDGDSTRVLTVGSPAGDEGRQERQYAGVRITSTERISSRPIHIRKVMYSFAAFEKGS